MGNGLCRSAHYVQEPPSKKAVVLHVSQHCPDCSRRVGSALWSVDGVESVDTDIGKSQATVKGAMDVAALKRILKRKLNKSAQVISEEDVVEEAGENEGEGGDECGAPEANPWQHYGSMAGAVHYAVPSGYYGPGWGCPPPYPPYPPPYAVAGYYGCEQPSGSCTIM